MLNEIGFARLVKYFIFGLWDEIFRLLPWSPVRILWMNLFGAEVSWSAVVERVNFMNLDRKGYRVCQSGKKALSGWRRYWIWRGNW